MADRHGSWPAVAPPPPGYLPPRALPPRNVPPRDLPPPIFSHLPPRPSYREPHPITTGSVVSGLAATTVWLVLFGSLGGGLGSYVWWTIGAALAAWAVAAVLAVIGDRGVAVGVALASGLGLSVALLLTTLRWVTTHDWPLW